jgi:hypothetical protein
MALPIFDRAKDLLAEETVFLRLERPVVDRLRLENLAVSYAPESLPEKRGSP